MCFVFPTLGISLAMKYIYSVYYADRILGIDKCKPFLERYEDEINKVVGNRQDTFQSHVSLSVSQSPSDNHIIAAEGLSGDFDTETVFPGVTQLKNWLVDEMADSGIYYQKYDNAPYMASLLHSFGPKKAKKIKHCILNQHILVGFDSAVYMHSPFNNVMLTSDISVSGPGGFNQYQTSINPSYIRFLSIAMISQLEETYTLDDSSYTEIFITFSQLIFILLKCIETEGDRWTKSIMIIYTAMSILNTLSLVILHKQLEPFSLHYSSNITLKEIAEDYDIITKNTNDLLYIEDTQDIPSQFGSEDTTDLLYTGSFLHFILEGGKLGNKSGGGIFELDDFNHGGYCIFGGLLGSMLIFIWADYTSYKVTEWLVLFWVACSVIISSVEYFDFIRQTSSSWLLKMCLIPIVACSFVCIISATIIGYSTKYKSY
ncbi:hypothetical protein F4703DRAFT_1877918 [Phycomyces blakesleeanus]